MRSRRRLLLLALLTVLAWLGVHLAAQSPPAVGPGTSGTGGEEELETFTPSERVPADTAVAFPVDI